MKKKWKGLSALILSMAMIVTMGLPAFATSSGSGTAVTANDKNAAAGASTATITVTTDTNDTTKGYNGDTLYAYRVIDATLDNSANTLTYSFTQKFMDFQASEDGKAYQNITPDIYAGYDTTNLKAVLSAFTAYVKVKKVEADYTSTTENNVATFSKVAMGQYIIVGSATSTGAYVYQTVSAEVVPFVDKDSNTYKIYPKYSITMKTTKPTGSKTIDSGTNDDGTGDTAKKTASIGDTITYTIMGTVPTYPANATNTTYYQRDLLSDGLTLSSTAASIDVYGYIGDKATKLTNEIDYTVTIDGQNLYIDYKYDLIKKYEKVTATYKAVLNDNAKIGTKDGNTNTYDLVWSNAPYDGTTYTPGSDEKRPTGNGYGSIEDTKIVYTYALIIDKYEETTAEDKLAGAEFDIKDSAGKTVGHITTDSNGAASYVGLKAGKYTLKETKAPAGYKLAQDITITIDSSATTAFASATTTTTVTYTSDSTNAIIKTQAMNDQGVLLWVNSDGKTEASATKPATGDYSAAYVASRTTAVTTSSEAGKGSASDGYYKVGVADAKGTALPTTGGMGTTLFTIIGIALMVGAAVVIISKKRLNGFSE